MEKILSRLAWISSEEKKGGSWKDRPTAAKTIFFM